MNIIFNNISSNSFSKETILPIFSLTPQQKKIALIIAVVLEVIASLYVLKDYFFGNKPHEIDEIEFDYEVEKIDTIALKVINKLFDDITVTSDSSDQLQNFSFSICHPDNIPFKHPTTPLTDTVSASLIVKVTEKNNESDIPLTHLVKAIPWDNLDQKWHQLTEEQWTRYSSHAVCRDYQNLPKIPFSFILEYSDAQYTPMNQLLRTGKIKIINPIPKNLQDEDVPTLIDRVAKEQLFRCLCLTGELQALRNESQLDAESVLKTESLIKPKMVVRRIHSVALPRDFFKKYKKGHIITEESFLSTSKVEVEKELSHFGDIKYMIKLACSTKGTSIESLSRHSEEQEYLLPPFTSFHVEHIQQGLFQETIIHLQEVNAAG